MSKTQDLGSPSSQPQEDLPPYTLQASQNHIAQDVRQTRLNTLPLILTLEHHKPLYLRSIAGEGRIDRPGPSETITTDAILLTPTATYHSILSILRFRADRKFNLAASGYDVEATGRLWLVPRAEGEQGRFEVDSENWEAVRGLLEGERGNLMFVVWDVPRGWEVDPKGYAGREGKGKEFSRWDVGGSKMSGKEAAREGKNVAKAGSGGGGVGSLQGKSNVKPAPGAGAGTEKNMSKSNQERKTEKGKDKEKRGESCCVM